ncbi:MAG: hypothetical protein A2Z78_00470 [Candidatus Nealsonbacteria bacterium RBG_13_36_15]|uniref:Uncharacterized protein n=1 Tax=Candidatus Nealsonbacteria bacterium RBG_13_36_15 TaxID=1801660 RepID=A0A1G2DVC3_9BACT|nr:MAG: hypothetical protein A2Z78_00470 [Candidatus Nealsonbacteria bacterium RBG_13_36_15]
MVKIFLEKEEALKRYSQMINVRFPAITAFLLVALILRLFLNTPFPNVLFLLISLMAISTIIYDLFFRKIREPKTSQIINGYFGYMLFDLIILTMTIYILGGIIWIGFIFYGLYIYIGFLLFPRSYSIFYIFYCSFLYTLLVIIQYLEVFPEQIIFSLEERIPQNLSYVLATWTGSVVFILVLGYYGDVFYKILQGKIEELQKVKILLEEARMSLGIRVRARTRELWEERRGLEKKVQERTGELEEERKNLDKRISELEKFHKVAVGRELKMRELKRENKEFKEKISKKLLNK